MTKNLLEIIDEKLRHCEVLRQTKMYQMLDNLERLRGYIKALNEIKEILLKEQK